MRGRNGTNREPAGIATKMEMEVGAWMARVDLPNRSNSPRRASWPAPVAPCDFFQRPIFPGDLGARTWSAHPVDGSGIIPARPIPRTGIHTPDVAGHSAYREERGSGAVRPHIWDRIPVFPRAFRCQGACFHQCDPLNIPRTRYTPRLKLQSEHSFQPKTHFLAFNAAMSVPNGTVRDGPMFPERKSCHRL